MIIDSNLLLLDIVTFRTYAKHLSHLGRRESFAETINRNMSMQLDKFPKLSKDIIKAYQRVHERKVMPSMRALQFSGQAVLKNEVRQYNCSYAPVNDVRVFGEILFLLLSGTGVGFSVQRRHVNQLPKITKPREEGFFFAHDSIIGWAQCVDILMESYFYGRIRPQFDFGNIRPKGSYLVTTGARAPGPEPLKKMLEMVEEKLKLAMDRKLSSIEIHDIICIISDSVLTAGIRRSATISLFDRDDNEMLKSKHGDWWNTSPWRARANNSAVLPRDKVTKEEFDYIFKMCRDSNAGEPGFGWTNNEDWGVNPCFELSLNPNQFCNLTTINQTGIVSEKDLMNRVYAATLIGTLQASYTDFPYLRPVWKETTERESLIGVSFTGIADAGKYVTNDMLINAAKLTLDVNEKYAKKIGINQAARTTVLKPEGSSSCVLSSSSGIHARHADFYLRRIRMNKDDALAVYLKSTIPELVEDDKFSSSGVVVIIPQKSPNGAITRHNETAVELFNRVINYNKNWIKPGHRSGDNRNNVSTTISLRENEWDEMRELMWENREHYSGISLLPHDGGSYVQAPFEDCTEEQYLELSKAVKDIDLKLVKEEQDNTTRIETLSCAGGQCEIV